MAEWDTAYINDLPDSAFLLVLPGGRKDADGKTLPRSLRYFPVENAAGDVDTAHLRNALAQIPKASTLTAAQRMAAMDKAKSLAKAHPTVGGPPGTYEGTAGSGRSRPVEVMPAEVMGLQIRTGALTLELRADGDGRTLIGRAVPYGETAQIPGGRERFVMGAFARQISTGPVSAVKLHASHGGRVSGDFAIGKTVDLTERTDGLHGAWQLYDTARGNEALQLVKTGELTGMSIGFKAVDGGTRKGADGAFERHAAHLDHVILTNEPAYAGAAVMAVRTVAHPIGAYRTEALRARQILQRVTGPV